MTLFPVVERELRVSSRRKETFWTRVGLAFAAIAIGALTLFFTTGLPPTQTGRYIFECLACLAFLYCLAQGRRATADSISSEKREGTLGLLFLTDLKGHDIVLGKLTATSLRGFYGLLAVFPVLAIPLLLGGVSNGEFWRVVIVLVNTFLFSLAVGIFTSSISRDYRHAMGANLLAFLFIAAIPAGAALAIAYFSGKRIIAELFWSCPAYSLYLCADAKYGLQPSEYWSSTAVIHALTWLLIGVASGVAPRSWHDHPVRSKKSRFRDLWRAWNYGPVEKQAGLRRQMLNVNAFYWLAGRAIRKPAHVRTFLFCVGLWWITGWLTSGEVWFDSSIAIVTALMLNGTLKTWVAIEAGQQLADDKRSGAFELLLTVPLKVREILRGQLLALKRQFAAPLAAVIFVEIVLMRTAGVRAGNTTMWLAGIIMLLADLLALIWVAMEAALTTRSHNHATLKAMTRVLFLPWLAFGLIWGVCNVVTWLRTGREWEPTTTFCVGLWFCLGLAADLFFGLIAVHRLTTKFHELALRTRRVPLQPQSQLGQVKIAERISGKAATESNDEIGTGLRAKKRRVKPLVKLAVSAFTLLSLITIWFVFIRGRGSAPEPVVIRIHAINTPLQVAANHGGALIVMPDGTLWRWGLSGQAFSIIPVPEQIGTNSDWVKATASGNHYLALRKDGTLWEWGRLNALSITEPKQVGTETNWTAISVSSAHSLALKREGTLWAWNDFGVHQLESREFEAFQVRTSTNWSGIACYPNGSFAIRSDGTLWGWLPPWVSSPSFNANPLSMRVSKETNWIEIVNGSVPMFRNQSGEIWGGLLAALPDGNSSISTSCRMLVSNSLPDAIAIAASDTARIFELHADGTLWQKPFPGYPGSPNSNQNQKWTRVGKRSDWTRLWSSGGTAFGLTKDGTIWTWGFDATRAPQQSIASYLQNMQASVQDRLGKTATTTGKSGRPRRYQKEPRPLMRVVPD